MQVAETFAFPIPAEELPAEVQAQLVKLLPAAAAARKPPCPTGNCPVITADSSRKGLTAGKGNAQAALNGAGKGDNSADVASSGTAKKGGKKSGKRGDDVGGEQQVDQKKSDGDVLSELQLSDWVRLDTCVTVVDASVFLDNLHSIEELRDRWAATESLHGCVQHAAAVGASVDYSAYHMRHMLCYCLLCSQAAAVSLVHCF